MPAILAAAIVAVLLLNLSGCAYLKNITSGSTAANEPAAENLTSDAPDTAASTEDSETGDEDNREESGSTLNNIKQSSSDTEASSAEKPGQNYNISLKDYDTSTYGIKDLERQREYFIKGVGALEIKDYIVAEYYFNQVKETYVILQDHVLYYLAKSLLFQDKFDSAEENYLRLKENFPDSIFGEKAALEYADLFFIKQEYVKAEAGYSSFIEDFSNSEVISYSIYQLAVCQEKNSKFSQAAQNYKKIWISYPESSYAANAFSAMGALKEKKLIEPFDISNNEIYKRGEIFFEMYMYDSAIYEFKQVLDNIKAPNTNSALEEKTLFKIGMCYFNLRDYASAKQYLLSCYKAYSSGSYADDCLYFLGRAETNLDRESSAIAYYDDLLKKFSMSNYADDALYRLGRIYFLKDDFENAAKSYQKIADLYPSGDKINDAYWELGWIHYRSGNYSAARDTFKNMAARFKGSQLGEKALFWQAKSLEKTGDKEAAIVLYRDIVNLKSYTYYTFAAKNILEKNGITIQAGTIDTEVYPDNPKIRALLPKIYDNLFNEDKNSSQTANVTGNENTGASSSTDTAPETVSDTNVGTKTIFTHTDKAKELLIIEFYKSADTEIEKAAGEYEDDEFGWLQISTLYLLAKDYIGSQKVISKNYSKLRANLTAPYKDHLYYLTYPYGFKEYVDKYSSQFEVDPLFVLAVIREESRFNPDAGSYAGAQGLMQVMPATGKGIASALGIKNFNNDMLLDPETSIKMGAYYLRKQLDNFSQNKFYACGAYNGGPGAMSSWLSRFGDKDIDEFIEHITYEETRNYVKKVMGSYYFYQMLYESQ